MRGHIKLGGRWLPFRASEVLAPLTGSRWHARVAGVISGFDRYAGGEGSQRWRLFGAIPVMSADGPDISRSAEGRFGGEGVWVPTTLLPRFGVEWQAVGDLRLSARYRAGESELEVDSRSTSAGG